MLGNIRLRIFLILVLLISLSITARIIYLVLRSPEDYIILEKGEYTVRRGDIYDRNGHLLAVSDELESVYANPREIISIEYISDKLSKALNIPQNKIVEIVSQKKSFVWVKRQVTPKQAELIRILKMPGIGLKKEYKRFYPNKRLASHILGFCNIDSRGVEGIEKGMDPYLISNIGEKDFLELNNEKEGLNITLTIDSNIQALSERIITRSVKNENADAGSLLLLDGKTGEILSMANYPDFDPNYYKDFTQKDFRNYLIFNQFEPGSVFKIFTLASLLDSSSITSSDFFYCDGIFEKDNYTVKCTGIHGSVNYFGIIKYSCNDGMIQACKNISDNDLFNYLRLFGFGMRTSIRLPGEQIGILRNIKKWTKRSMFAIPLGQEVSVNALQIVRAATTFLNDGIMIEPHIIKSISNIENKVLKNIERKEIRRVYKSGISNEVLRAMKSSTTEGGTVSGLNIEGVEFAAKSGTGQIYDPRYKKYLEDDFTSSLLLIFPYKSPRFIAYVIFHKPQGRIKWGGVIGAKVFNELISGLTGYMNLNIFNEFQINKNNIGIKNEFQKVKTLPAKMPNLTGLTAGDIMDIFSEVKVDIKVYGNGRIVGHEPKKNEIINEKATIKLYLED